MQCGKFDHADLPARHRSSPDNRVSFPRFQRCGPLSCCARLTRPVSYAAADTPRATPLNTDRFIVITSIFPPTEAVKRFAQLEGWRVVVVGDRKTPVEWACPGVTFISADEQEKDRGQLARTLPWNHYSRKMLGYACAMGAGASVIVDADDDNLPKPGWGFPPFDGTFDTAADELGFVNVYSLFTDQRIWPRGFPLRRVNDPAGKVRRQQLIPAACRVGIWQALADGDPDVDAIYRLTDHQPCTFNAADPVVLGLGTLTPFNSQNTAFRKELFPLLYLPATVSFRFTDILRSLVAQPITWFAGFRVGITSATVVQERNPHDYLKDFESEIPCYLHVEQATQIIQAAVRQENSVCENLSAAYNALAAAGIVAARELDALGAWNRELFHDVA